MSRTPISRSSSMFSLAFSIQGNRLVIGFSLSSPVLTALRVASRSLSFGRLLYAGCSGGSGFSSLVRNSPFQFRNLLLLPFDLSGVEKAGCRIDDGRPGFQQGCSRVGCRPFQLSTFISAAASLSFFGCPPAFVLPVSLFLYGVALILHLTAFFSICAAFSASTMFLYWMAERCLRSEEMPLSMPRHSASMVCISAISCLFSFRVLPVSPSVQSKSCAHGSSASMFPRSRPKRWLPRPCACRFGTCVFRSVPPTSRQSPEVAGVSCRPRLRPLPPGWVSPSSAWTARCAACTFPYVLQHVCYLHFRPLLVAVGEFRTYVVEFLAAEVVPFRAADVAGSYVDACLCHNLSLFVGGYPFASPSSLPMADGSRGVPRTRPFRVIVCYNLASKVKPFGRNPQIFKR